MPDRIVVMPVDTPALIQGSTVVTALPLQATGAQLGYRWRFKFLIPERGFEHIVKDFTIPFNQNIPAGTVNASSLTQIRALAQTSLFNGRYFDAILDNTTEAVASSTTLFARGELFCPRVTTFVYLYAWLPEWVQYTSTIHILNRTTMTVMRLGV